MPDPRGGLRGTCPPPPWGFYFTPNFFLLTRLKFHKNTPRGRRESEFGFRKKIRRSPLIRCPGLVKNVRVVDNTYPTAVGVISFVCENKSSKRRGGGGGGTHHPHSLWTLIPSPKAVGMVCVPPLFIPLLLPLQIPCSLVAKIISNSCAPNPHSARSDSDREIKREAQSLGGAVQGGGGYSDIFIQTYRLGTFFWVQNFEFQYFGVFRKMNFFCGMRILFKILNFNIFGGFQKNEFFGGMRILWIFGGHHKIGLYLGVISIHFRFFS